MSDAAKEAGQAPLRDFRHSLPMELLKAREAAMARFRPMLREHGLTEQQWRVVRALSEFDRIDAGELAERSFLLAPSLTRILQYLEYEGLIRRTPGSTDQRKSVITLTATGRRMFEQIAPESESLYSEIEASFGVDRLETLYELLAEFYTTVLVTKAEVKKLTRKHPEFLNPEDALLAFRACLGQFATGVTVVTCGAADGHPRGITANSFSSVSLEPPLILWNIAKSSNSFRDFLQTKHFAIHILSKQQQALSSHFARTDHTRFDGVKIRTSDAGVPLLPNCLAVFECSTYQTHDCGDHHIIVGHVDRFTWERSEPLLFFSGSYRGLGDTLD